jgi:hypothetical protein
MKASDVKRYSFSCHSPHGDARGKINKNPEGAFVYASDFDAYAEKAEASLTAERKEHEFVVASWKRAEIIWDEECAKQARIIAGLVGALEKIEHDGCTDDAHVARAALETQTPELSDTILREALIKLERECYEKGELGIPRHRIRELIEYAAIAASKEGEG